MRNTLYIAFTFFLGLVLTSCSSDSEDFVEKKEIPTSPVNPSTATTAPASALDVENFFYRGMSDIYLYKNDVPVLADDYFATEAAKTTYLKNFASPGALFKKLTATQDKFSYFDDYNEPTRSAAGTEKMHGMSYGLVSYCNSCQEVLGYVRFVYPNTSAQANGVERGMIFNRVNDQQLTRSNIANLLGSSSLTIGLAKIENGTVSNLEQSISMSVRESVKNPVVLTKVLTIEGTKVGYLYYDSFSADFDEELNAAFTDFKSKGVKELVLDLRYNGGGSVRTATDLASMITGQFQNQVFMKEKWNDKYQKYYEENDPQSLLNEFNTKLRTGTSISSLNLNRVFVLTTNSSASASELIINGLEPYIDVVQIGDVTTGKFQASVALYDSPDFSRSHGSLKTSHTYFIQPLVLKSLNANNVSDYTNGLNPDFVLREDITDLGVLGDSAEPLFKIAIDIITGNRVAIQQPKTFPEVGESEMFKLDYQKMYLDPEDLPAIKQ